MKKSKLLVQTILMSIAVCIFWLAGCESTMVNGSDDGVLMDNSVTEMSSVKTIKMVPYKGNYSGSGWIDFTRDDCPEGSVAISGTGSGVASHLGKIDVYFSHCSYFILDQSNPTFVDGYGITTAANGDQIFGTYYGYLTGPDKFVDVVTLTNGTGRFENISGSFTEYGKVAFTSETSFDYEITIEGEISSVGSSK